jgi:hypothetical protein
LFIYFNFQLRMLKRRKAPRSEPELSRRVVVQIPERQVCCYYGSKLLFSALIGVCGLESTNAHRSEDDPVLWVNWESFSTWHKWYQTPMHASKYVIKGIVKNAASASGNVFIEFPDLKNQGGGYRWSKDQLWLKKWVVSRGAFPLGKERMDEESLNEWYHMPVESGDSSSGGENESENSEYTTSPRGVPDPKLVEVLKKGSDKGTVVTATVPVVAGGAAKAPRKRRGPAKGGGKQKEKNSGGTPRGVHTSQNFDSDSTDPRAPSSGEEEDQVVPPRPVAQGEWLDGPGPSPDVLEHTATIITTTWPSSVSLCLIFLADFLTRRMHAL